MRRRLQPQALADAYRAGASVRELAQQHGVSHTTIHRRLKGWVVMRKVGGPVGFQSPQEVQEAVAAAYANDVPMADIVDQFGVCDETVRRIAEAAGIPRRKPGGRTRLDHVQIADLADLGWPPDAIAELVQSSPSYIRSILAAPPAEDDQKSGADANTAGE
ncbi:helix-turn-helix domain-containing protein [Nonomuraea sp. NPDC050547]|uniref:helix-turn-helix domain-containing protein n=1 Tax=Nonomuraea sp. NPDC050547 TaxID=3364368 RepID=UPI00379DB1F5